MQQKNAAYSAGSISKSDSVVDESLRLMIKDYFHTTYSARSHSESDSLEWLKWHFQQDK